MYIYNSNRDPNHYLLILSIITLILGFLCGLAFTIGYNLKFVKANGFNVENYEDEIMIIAIGSGVHYFLFHILGL